MGVALTTPIPVSTSLATVQPLDPAWWVNRLYKKLQVQRDLVERFDCYYRGAHPLPWLAPQARDPFRRILQMARSNYCGLVVDALVEQLEVQGFRVLSETVDPEDDQADGDDAAWRIWQANNLDAYATMAFLEAAKSGLSFMLVAPNAGGGSPLVTVEHPAQCVVEYEPGSLQQRAAGLKVWLDDRVNLLMATLYLPGYVYKWQAPNSEAVQPKWQPRRVAGEEGPARNPLGEVPLVELANNPQLLRGGVSELSDVTDIQDRINKTLADRLMTQDFGAFPQKWATGWELSDDEITTDADGNQVVTPRPLDIGRDRLLRVGTGVEFGSFAAAPLDPYSNAKSEDVRDIAARTRTPPHYLLGSMVNMSAEALDAAMSGLNSKVAQRQRPFGEALEEVMRLAFRLVDDPRADDMSMQTIWKDTKYQSLAGLTDAVIKQRAAGLISESYAQEKLGVSPQDIKRMGPELRAERVQQAALGAIAGTNQALAVPSGPEA